MTSSYSQILRRPGALRFSAAGLLARFPMSMMGISTILAVQELYGSYAAAGRVSAAGVVATAVGAPLLSRRVDAAGQARVMVPAVIGSVLGLAGLVAGASAHLPEPALMVLSALAGGLSGSMGSLVRSRWTAMLRTPEDIHTAFSLEAALDEVAFIVGPILATALCTSPFLPVSSGWVASMLLQVGGSLWFLSQRATEPPVHPRPTDPADGATRAVPATTPGGGPGRVGDAVGRRHREPRHVLLYGSVASVVTVFLLSGAMFGTNDVAVVAFATERGSASASGAVLACWGAGSMIAALVYGSRPWPWPLWKQLTAGVVALAVGASTFALAPGLVVLCLAMFLTGMAIAPTVTTGNNVVQAIVPPQRLTEGLAWLATAMNVGVSLGSMLGGLAVDHAGAHGGFLLVAAWAWGAVVMAVAWLPVLRRARPRHVTHLDED